MAKKRRRNEPETTTTTILDLPPDVLLMILTRLNYNERLSSLSLVSSSFRSLVSRLVQKLTFNRSLPSNSAFRKLLTRFSSVSRIVIRSTRIARALTAIAKSGLKIECLEIQGKPSCLKMEQIMSLSGKFEAVKALKLDWFTNASNRDVAEFVNLFPSLEDLDLSDSYAYAWSDEGIETLASKAPNLRKVIMDSNLNLTDRSLDALSSNCVNLEHVCLKHFGLVSVQGLSAFVRKLRNLKWLDMPYSFKSTMRNDDILTLAETMSSCENLSHLSLNNEILMKDAFLSIIANSPSPLTSLEFTKIVCDNYTMVGVSAMLRGFQKLTKLHLCTPWGTQDAADQDMRMSQLVKSLPRLKEVYLFSKSAVYATLFSLIQNCSLLESINIKDISSNAHFDVPQQIKKNFSIQHIVFHSEPIHAVKIALKLACPSLKTLKF